MIIATTLRSRKAQILALVLAMIFSTGADAASRYGKNVTPLSADSTYVRSTSKSDFWKLIPYSVPQSSDRGSALASTVAVWNAFFAADRIESDEKNFDEAEVSKLSPKLKKGKALLVDDFAAVLAQALEPEGEGAFEVVVERFSGKDSKAELKRLQTLLSKNDRNPNDFVIANFLQSVAMGNRKRIEGVYAPVGAFDPNRKRVLLLDTDRKNGEPYWVPLDKFLDAMNTSDPGSSKKRGLIVIRRL
jgi:hypothetical protein